ncbi:hypothetical protein, partial [Vibrio cholerae]|uniref:hypothetical protein n=1 Tax=Vibrio cholerae TaxID=666 RepID=UPI001E4E3B13
LIVLRPVSYLFFRFAHVTTALTVTRDQIAELGKGSTYLGNNAEIKIKYKKIPPQRDFLSSIFLCFTNNGVQLRQQFFGLFHHIFSGEAKQFEQFTGWC